MINDFMAGAIELLAKGFFRQRKTNRVGNTLTQRASGGLNAGV